MLVERMGKDEQATKAAELPCKLLVADDQPHILEALRLLLKPEGYQLEMVRTPALVLEALAHESFDGVLIDLNYTRDTTSGQEGLDLVARVKEMDAELPVVVMTAWGNIDLAVEAMRRGAGDFIQKPWENARLLSILRTQMELHRSQTRMRWLEAENRILRAPGAPDFIASAASMRTVLETMARVGPSDANVLITGEHGTGKEVVAQTLHALSPRSSAPMVTVNAGGLSEGVFESELFGHVKGAFTDARVDRVGRFELADNGTLFLDEIANVPLKLQAKLLRVLQDGALRRVGDSKTRQIDVRVIAATQRPLAELVAAGTFREDLRYRLEVIAITVPALRERDGDLPLLVDHMLARLAAGKASPKLTRSAVRALGQHRWPGNVRELENALARGLAMAGDTLDVTDLPEVVAAAAVRPEPAKPMSGDDLRLKPAIAATEQAYITAAMERAKNNQTVAARLLGLSRFGLQKKLRRLAGAPDDDADE